MIAQLEWPDDLTTVALHGMPYSYIGTLKKAFDDGELRLTLANFSLNFRGQTAWQFEHQACKFRIWTEPGKRIFSSPAIHHASRVFKIELLQWCV